MAFGMSLAVFSLVIEVTSFSRIVICIEKKRDVLCVCVCVCVCTSVCYTLISQRARAYLYWSANKCFKWPSYLIAGVTLTGLQQAFVVIVRVQMCTQCVRGLQWFPSGRCYCRNRASSLRDKGGPEAVCPSAERRSSLRTEKRSAEKRDTGLCQKSNIQEVVFF